MPDDPQLAEAIEAARSELAADLGVDASEIELETAERVTWRDGSMGCPEPGMSYTQALVDGVRVLLKANSVTYHFHGALGSVPMVCSNPRVPPPID